MPKLNILHHKSYHPYLEKNKQRVREDEARAAAEELAREQARVDCESLNRLTELRRRAGSPSLQQDGRDEGEDDNLPSTSTQRDTSAADGLIEKHRKEKARQEKRERKAKERLDFDWPSETAKKEAKRAERRREDGYRDQTDGEREGRVEMGLTDEWLENGHINLFADVEKEQSRAAPSMAELAKKKKDQESDQSTVYLRPKDRDTKPWYSDRDLRRYEDMEDGEQAEERRARDKRKDARSKNRHDPLTQITSLLPKPTSLKPSTSSSAPIPSVRSATEARLSRESSERQKALALIAKAKADKAKAKQGRWDDTPMSAGTGGGTWAEDFERQKDRAGMRFYDPHPVSAGRDRGDRGRDRRMWDV